jgi:hypothetical protein
MKRFLASVQGSSSGGAGPLVAIAVASSPSLLSSSLSFLDSYSQSISTISGELGISASEGQKLFRSAKMWISLHVYLCEGVPAM